MTLLFDGLALTRRLETGGTFTRPQAEALVDGLHDALLTSVSTKNDLQDVKKELQDVKSELKADVALLRSDMTGKFNLLQWMLAASLAFLMALLGLMLHLVMH